MKAIPDLLTLRRGGLFSSHIYLASWTPLYFAVLGKKKKYQSPQALSLNFTQLLLLLTQRV